MNSKVVLLAKKRNLLSKIILLSYALIYRLNKSKDPSLYKVLSYYEMKPSISLIKELLWTRYIFGGVYQQYFQYDFKNKTIAQRMEYIGSFEMTDFVLKNGTKHGEKVLHDKYESYQKFEKFYSRKIIKINNSEDISDFLLFCENNKSFIAKPINSNGGHGIKIYNLETQTSIEIFTELLAMGGAVCEELISQCDEMAKYHPQSVNTVRVVTFYDNEKLSLVFAMLRMGSGDSSVDNTSAGGISAAVDVETGRVTSRGLVRMNKENVFFDNHPDTDVRIKDSVIPQWNELIDMLKQLVTVLEEQKCVGWDLALTDNGWIMVEGNPNPLFSTIQVLEQHGYREKIERLKK